MSTRSCLAACLIAGALVALPRAARAQNQDPYFYGDDAALMAGSTVASGRDSGAIWYNPAGLGGVGRGSISASASTFGFRIRRIPNALRVRIAGQERGVDLKAFDILSVPNAVVAATALSPRVTLAGGLLTTQRDLVSTLGVVEPYTATDDSGREIQANQRLDLQADYSKYHFGPAVGIELAPGVRIGFALFGTYSKATQNVGYALQFAPVDQTVPERAFVTASARVTGTYFGLAGSAGIQWDLGSVALGLSLRSPEIALAASNEGGAVTTGTRVGGGGDPVATYEETRPDGQKATGELVVPGRALVGVAIPLAPSSWLEIGADAAHGLPSGTLATSREPVVNARAGLRYMLSPGWVVGGGLFTDRANQRILGDFVTDSRVDWYGLTAGVSKRTPLALKENPEPEALVLVTTLSLRAGAGFGQSRASTIDLSDDSPRDDRSDVMFFEIMPYLGSSVVF